MNEKVCTVLHWNYRGFTKFPIECLNGEEDDVTDIYLKENLISRVPSDICKLRNLESLYLSGNDIDELPPEISSLRCLKCLDLSGNRLRRIPDEIGEMRGLKFLILDENELHSLPTRIGELRALRYLSVCGNRYVNLLRKLPSVEKEQKYNKLQWLPQRPVYNYYHCEFKFWRNTELKTIPYSLWYHMFRDQQTRSLNIGCLNVTNNPHTSRNIRCLLAMHQDSRLLEIGVSCPPQYNNIIGPGTQQPPSLFELSKRIAYQMILTAAKKFTMDLSTNSNKYNFKDNCDSEKIKINNMQYLESTFKGFQIDKTAITAHTTQNNRPQRGFCSETASIPNSETKNRHLWSYGKRTDFYVPSDIINKLFPYLPYFIKSELCNGPISNCENVYCKKSIFDYIYYEFCLEKIILIDSTEDIILSATFCSKTCGDYWKLGKEHIIPWRLISLQ